MQINIYTEQINFLDHAPLNHITRCPETKAVCGDTICCYECEHRQCQWRCNDRACRKEQIVKRVHKNENV